MSQELENSLQQAVETYLNDRLRSINEEVSRLQAEISETLTRLRDNSGDQSLEGTALSAAIFAHLQTARGQRLSGVTVAAPPAQDARQLKLAIQSIEQQPTQTEVLKSLLTGSAQFAERVALFVIKNEQAIGWRSCQAGNPDNLEMIGGVSLPLTAETIVTRAANSRSAVAANVSETSENQLLIDQLGGQPQFVNAIPLIVRNKVVAVLYADAASSEETAINADALEALARVAAMAVNLTSIHRAQPAPRTQAVTPSVEAAPPPAAPESREPAEPTYTPQVEPQTVEAPPQAAAIETVGEATEEMEPVPPAPTAETAAEAEPPAPPVVEQTASEPAPPQLVTEPPPAETVSAPPSAEPAPTPPPAQPPAGVPFASQYATPLGNARRYGVSEPELPIEVSEEERRLHNDARRFARLLVSEIKLYNEPKVREGRNAGDLYDRLRDDIDRSRQMYDKRVAPPVAARHDYFHQELVNTLAEGDPEKLGASYPGAAVTA